MQNVDEEYTGQVKEQVPSSTLQEQSSNQIRGSSSTDEQQPPVDIAELVARIRDHVTTNRIRVSEHFEDFDPLRSGSIYQSRFRQVQGTSNSQVYKFTCM